MQYRLCSIFITCYLTVFIFSDYKNLYLLSILHLYHHLFAELVHLYNLPLYWVFWGHRRFLVFDCKVVWERPSSSYTSHGLRESLHIATHSLNYSLFFTYIFWSSLSFTLMLHLYPKSKLLNKLNIIPWGVVTSHIQSISCKIYWKLVNTTLVTWTIHESILKEERFHI